MCACAQGGSAGYSIAGVRSNKWSRNARERERRTTEPQRVEPSRFMKEFHPSSLFYALNWPSNGQITKCTMPARKKKHAQHIRAELRADHPHDWTTREPQKKRDRCDFDLRVGVAQKGHHARKRDNSANRIHCPTQKIDHVDG